MVLPYTNDDPVICRKLEELGAAGVLMNTAVEAQDPIRMAKAMKLAVEAGWLAAHAGRIPRKLYASASSPMTGLIE